MRVLFNTRIIRYDNHNPNTEPSNNQALTRPRNYCVWETTNPLSLVSRKTAQDIHSCAIMKGASVGHHTTATQTGNHTGTPSRVPASLSRFRRSCNAPKRLYKVPRLCCGSVQRLRLPPPELLCSNTSRRATPSLSIEAPVHTARSARNREMTRHTMGNGPNMLVLPDISNNNQCFGVPDVLWRRNGRRGWDVPTLPLPRA